MTERMLPNKLFAERGVLGCLVYDPGSITHVADILRPEHFYRDIHQTIYAIMLALYDRQEVADIIALQDELERRGKLEEVGGIGYITGLIEEPITSARIASYAQKVIESWQKRKVIEIGLQMVQAGYEEEEDALAQAETAIYQLRKGESHTITLHTDALNNYLVRLIEQHDMQQRGVLSGLSTGYKVLDKKLGGLRKSKLYVFAGRPGDGKSALLQCIIDTVVRHGGNCLLFSLEMERDELMQRWLSMEARVDAKSLRDFTIDGDEWDRVTGAGETLNQVSGKWWIDDTPNMTFQMIRAKAQRLHAEYGLDMIGVDYLQIMQPGENKKLDRRLQIEEISRNLKILARELQIPVVALAQLNRDGANREPSLEHLREGGIENDCDVAGFLWPDPNRDPDNVSYNVDLLIKKNRSGAMGKVPLYYVGPNTRFFARAISEEED